MSSRQEEKAQRRAEREAQEKAAASKAAMARRLRLAGAGAAATAILVVSIVLVAGSGGKKTGDSAQTVANAVKVPPVKQTDLVKAIKTAGCVQLNPAMEGRDHVTTTVTYKNSNPPASGPHSPIPAQDGIYSPGNEPTKEHWVHTLEHGRVEIQYAPGTSTHVREQLETVGSEKYNGTAGHHVLVFQNNTKMPYAVAAVAWTHVLGCKKFNENDFDAIRAFRKTYTDKGPELIP